MNVLVLVGSTRTGSFNVQLAESAIALLPEGTTASRFEKLLELPFYTDALDNETDRPAVVRELDAAIEAADALLLVTPEYNGGPPAQMKNVIDWASRPRGNAPIAGKRVAVIGASPSPGGTARSRAAIVLNLTVAGAAPIEDTVGIAKAHETMTDGLPEETVAELRALLERLVPVSA